MVPEQPSLGGRVAVAIADPHFQTERRGAQTALRTIARMDDCRPLAVFLEMICMCSFSAATNKNVLSFFFFF